MFVTAVHDITLRCCWEGWIMLTKPSAMMAEVHWDVVIT